MLKITMPIYTATFPQDFLSYFLTGGALAPPGPPLESPMSVYKFLISTVDWIDLMEIL